MLIFGALGPIIRRKCPEGFVLTEWTRQRYGTVTMLYLSFLTLVTLFLYMVAELSALGQVVQTLTGLDPLPVIIVECVITTIYTCKFVPAGHDPWCADMLDHFTVQLVPARHDPCCADIGEPPPLIRVSWL